MSYLGTAVIYIGESKRHYVLPPQLALQVVARSEGWQGLDLEPIGDGRWQVTAYNQQGVPAIVKGNSEEEACQKLISKILRL